MVIFLFVAEDGSLAETQDTSAAATGFPRILRAQPDAKRRASRRADCSKQERNA